MDLIIIFFAVELVKFRVSRYNLRFEIDISKHLCNVIKQCRVKKIEKKTWKRNLIKY